MRKFLSILLAGLLAVVSLAGCAQSGGDTKQTSSATQNSQSNSQQSQSNSNQKPEDNKNANAEQKSGYPNQKIQIIVPFAAGGGTDAVGRVLAEALKSVLGVEVIVVNRTGGSGAIGMNEGLTAKPDGYTLTMVTREVASLPLLGTAPFKTMDFKFIANVNIDPAVVVVSTKSKYQTIEDLVKDLKDNPGKRKFAASAVPNYYAIQFGQEAEVDFITVPYQGAAPAITEILGGGADFGIYNPGEVKSHVEGGNLRPLAVMADERFTGFKDVPTLKEKGINAVSGTYRGIAVPPKTPEEIVKTLEGAIEKAVKDPKFVEFMNNSFLGIGYKNSADFKTMIENDVKVLEPIIEIAKKK